MPWLDAPEFERRPLVFVEDHLYHTTEMLAALASSRPDLIPHVAICAVDRPGPDTNAAVVEWLRMYPELRIVAALDTADAAHAIHATDRVDSLTAADLASAASFARVVARLLRPGGILVQDVQLGTLPFVPADRWWESIYVAATVRGLFADRPPTVRFLSNKRGYSATFGRDLMEAGFDPRDVMDKSELSSVVVPAIASLFDRAFPQVLDVLAPSEHLRVWPIAMHDEARREVAGAIDVVLWPRADGVDLCGRLIGDADARVILREGTHEAATWRALLADRINGGEGLSVISVGERVGPRDADRAELTNLAARHMHTLRGRLTDGSAIVTANHVYRIGDRVSVALPRPSSRGRSPIKVDA